MVEKTCACGASKKRFYKDIGPFFVGECCEASGYDALGRLVCFSSTLEQELETKNPTTVADIKRSTKPGRGKLRDMRVEQLKIIARDKGVVDFEVMTKNQLIETILK